MRYSLEDYNEDQVLKVPLTLNLALIYLNKYVFFLIVVPIIGNIPFFSRGGLNIVLQHVNVFVHPLWNVLFLFSSLPALLVLIAFIKRSRHTERQIYRTFWQQGYRLLWLSIGLELFLMVLFILLGVNQLNEWWIGFAYADVMLAWYLVKSQRVKDVFTEYPDYVESQK